MPTETPLEDRIEDPNADPTRSALQGCDRAIIKRAMLGLSERQTEVIRSLYYSGDSIHQVSVRWHVSHQAVQNQHLRALKVLRARLRHLGFR
jgi:RNA polymerase sigma factor (sigma-70 family)